MTVHCFNQSVSKELKSKKGKKYIFEEDEGSTIKYRMTKAIDLI